MKRTTLVLALMGCLAASLPGSAEFIRGIYTPGAETFDKLERLGFNLVVTPASDTNLAAAARHGFMVIPQPSAVGPGSRDLFASLRGNASVRAWYPYDEPDLYHVTFEAVNAERAWLRQNAPEKPLFLTVWSPDQYARFAPLADIFGIDPYPIVSAKDERRNRLERVFAQTAYARQLCPDTPLVVIAQCFFQNPWWERAPTAPELRNMVYQALAGGADGIIHFIWLIGGQDGKVWRLTDRPDLMAEMKKLNQEMRALDTALARGRLVGIRAEGGLVAGLRASGDRLFLLAANPTRQRGEMTLALPEPTAPPKIIFGARGGKAKLNGSRSVKITLPALGTLAAEFERE